MNRYFSEAIFRPDNSRPQDYRELALLNGNLDQQHKLLWQLFPNPPDTPRPFLYRHRLDDAVVGRHCARFWLLSEQLPTAPDSRWQLRSKRYAPQFRNGQCLRFELRTSPSVARVNPRLAPRPGRQIPRSSRFDPVALALAALPKEQRAAERQRWIDEKLALWLREKAARCGFDCNHLSPVTVLRYEPVDQPRDKGGDLRFSIADFSGELEVTDAQQFAQTALNGLGHQRGFGCGLLLLRPTQTCRDSAPEDEQEDE